LERLPFQCIVVVFEDLPLNNVPVSFLPTHRPDRDLGLVLLAAGKQIFYESRNILTPLTMSFPVRRFFPQDFFDPAIQLFVVHLTTFLFVGLPVVVFGEVVEAVLCNTVLSGDEL
jgi:hypothetical protein